MGSKPSLNPPYPTNIGPLSKGTHVFRDRARPKARRPFCQFQMRPQNTKGSIALRIKFEMVQFRFLYELRFIP